MMDDLKTFEGCVCKLKNAGAMNENVFGALVSFAYNMGCEAVVKEWAGMVERGEWGEVCEKMPGVMTLGGVLEGRRRREGGLCKEVTGVGSGC